jgi:site-specific recombinase
LNDIVQILERIKTSPEERSAAALLDMIRALRPGKKEEAGAALLRVRALIALLRGHPPFAEALRSYLDSVFASRLQRNLFANLGILGNEGMARALAHRLGAKILPPAYDDTYLGDLFGALTHEIGDTAWIAEIPEETIAELLGVIQLGAGARVPARIRMGVELLEALRILSFRLAAIGVEPDFLRYDSRAARRESPFVAQTEEVQNFVTEALRALDDPSTAWPDTRHLDVLLEQCTAQLKRIRQRAHQGGASIALTYEGQRASQIIARMRQITELASPDTSQLQQTRKIRFFRDLMHFEAEKSSLSALLTQATDLVALQITEHASRTGEHYVTSNRAEYFAMFRAAAGAGLVVAVMALLKIFIAKAHLPPLWQAVGFSLNYGLGFIIVHLFHFTIATKQPAMTAATIAASLGDDKGRSPSLAKLENLVIDVIRSQFIAIVGNVVFAFLACLAIGAGWIWLFGAPQIDEAKAHLLLHEIDPFASLALPHAAIAGVCLYLSGLISGYYDNKCVYARIPQRVRQLRWLARAFGEARRERIATYIENNLGALAGNFLFGCMLGSIGTLGFMLGWPLDIRHVTFSAANDAYALIALNFALPWQSIVLCGAGVLAIGCVNLLVSFSLALYTALKSRQIRFAHTRPLFGCVVRRLLRHPGDFVLPPRAERSAPRDTTT